MQELVTNYVLVIPASAWAVAQLIKVVLGLVREKRLGLRYFVASGGMPSSHTALVCSLATAVALTQGVGSVFFAITAIFALVVMYDAAGLRQAVGKQAEVLNRIARELWLRRHVGEMERDLRELIGHTPFQVIAGAVLGIAIAWLWLSIGSV